MKKIKKSSNETNKEALYKQNEVQQDISEKVENLRSQYTAQGGTTDFSCNMMSPFKKL